MIAAVLMLNLTGAIASDVDTIVFNARVAAARRKIAEGLREHRRWELKMKLPLTPIPPEYLEPKAD